MKYRKGFKYQLAEDEIFYTDLRSTEDIRTQFMLLETSGKFTIRSGYAWDGPSGPTIDRKSNMRGSLVHDALYQLIRNEWLPKSTRKYADELLCKCWIEDGMWKWLAKTEKKVLRMFAGFAAIPGNVKKVHEAPVAKYLQPKRELDTPRNTSTN